MILRYLHEGERSRVAPIFAEFECAPPTEGKIIVNELKDEIVSLQCFHPVNHAGPVWVRPDFRGRGLWQDMQRFLDVNLPVGTGYYQFGTERNSARLQELGLQPLGWTVWGKKV